MARTNTYAGHLFQSTCSAGVDSDFRHLPGQPLALKTSHQLTFHRDGYALAATDTQGSETFSRIAALHFMQ